MSFIVGPQELVVVGTEEQQQQQHYLLSHSDAIMSCAVNSCVL